MKNYSIDEIFDKRLYFLIPFHIFRYEAELPCYNRDEDKLNEIIDYYQKIVSRLADTVKEGKVSAYEARVIQKMSIYVIESMAKKYSKVKKGIVSVMGGEVLDYPEKHIYKAGIEQGEKRGEKRGLEKGEKRGREQVLRVMLANGFDTADLKKAGFTDEEIKKAKQ